MTNSKDKHDLILTSVNTVVECYLDSTYTKVLRSCKGNRKKADEIMECLSTFNKHRKDIETVLLDSTLDF